MKIEKYYGIGWFILLCFREVFRETFRNLPRTFRNACDSICLLIFLFSHLGKGGKGDGKMPDPNILKGPRGLPGPFAPRFASGNLA